jgi:uncharacterized pyridoxamine 5'-phosphate oxidase family protein
MYFQDCVDFIARNPGCALATVEGNQPRVRGMVPLWTRTDGIYFTTSARKKLHAQLVANPKVELCFMSLNPLKGLRVTGTVEFVADPELKTKALEERAFLKALGFGPDNPDFILFRVAHGEAHFWEWGDNLRESAIPRIVF